jgi:hypothetical protein
MRTWKLQSIQRENFKGVWRAGRFWPSAGPVEVQVLDTDDCPMVAVEDPSWQGGRRMALDPAKIGRKAWQAIVADPRISKFPEGEEPAGEVDRLRAQIAALEERLAAGASSRA